jgi:hypothetical protein
MRHNVYADATHHRSCFQRYHIYTFFSFRNSLFPFLPISAHHSELGNYWPNDHDTEDVRAGYDTIMGVLGVLLNEITAVQQQEPDTVAAEQDEEDEASTNTTMG